jgi:hypothetical protein
MKFGKFEIDAFTLFMVITVLSAGCCVMADSKVVAELIRAFGSGG